MIYKYEEDDNIIRVHSMSIVFFMFKSYIFLILVYI